MARRIKLTVFSRFLIVMLVLGPLAYMGASYYNGEDGIANLKKLLGIQQDAAVTTQESTASLPDTTLPPVSSSETTPETLRLEQENLELKKQLLEKEAEILELKKEIATLKSR
jgi:hypothetical protein